MYESVCPLEQALHTAFQNGLVNREDVFVTTKLWNTQHDNPVTAIKTSLKNLQLDYVDLYLVHWPVKLRKEAPMSASKSTEEDFLPLDMKSTWQGMEQCLEMRFTKAIGVEMHPQWQQKKLRDYCSKHNIHVSAWCPLGAPNTPWGSNAVMENPLIQEIAQKHGKTRAQVMLRWAMEQGASVLPKSYNPDRIFSNFQIFDWSLTPDDHEKIGMLKQVKLFRGDCFC